MSDKGVIILLVLIAVVLIYLAVTPHTGLESSQYAPNY